MFKVNNRNSRKKCEICLKSIVKIPERRQWRRSDVFINFEHILHLFHVFLSMTVMCWMLTRWSLPSQSLFADLHMRIYFSFLRHHIVPKCWCKINNKLQPEYICVDFLMHNFKTFLYIDISKWNICRRQVINFFMTAKQKFK